MLDLKSLNQAQREAVMHGEGPLLVLAGPGSGKTFTITQRIFFLLERCRISPENILVITFTKDAALSMQSRFLELSEQTFPVNFGTFHSVFYHILKESHFLDTKQSNPILTEPQKKKLLLPILKNYISPQELKSGQNDLAEETSMLLSAISFYKNTGEKNEAEKKLSEQLQSNFQGIFSEYERVRRKRKMIDFDDMVYECRRVLSKDAGLREYWQNRFHHILVDEFQDINPMQYEVLRLLLKEPYNIFAVGDDDQAIYGFRGSKPACLKQFVKDYQASQICLNINYRSRQEIIKVSQAVINENRDRFPKQLSASLDKDDLEYDGTDPVRLCAFEEREQQYQYLLGRLREQKKEKSIGVLFRTNSYMQALATRLSKEGIPYFMKEKSKSIYEHFLVKDIMAYIKVASGQGSRALFLQIMNKPSRYISRDSLGLGEGMPDFGRIMQYYERKEKNSQNMQVLQSLEKWKKQMEYLSKLSPFPAVQFIRKGIGYDNYLREKALGKKAQLQEWEELLHWLGSDAAQYKTMQEWVEAQEQYTNSLEQDKRGALLTENPVISLMTVHASKGLEFDTVLIPDCNEKIYPHGNMPDETLCMEERRIFYVALTRAKESLELLYLIGTKERPKLPSRFLTKLLKQSENHSSTNSSNSQLSRYSSNASATFSYSSSSSI